MNPKTIINWPFRVTIKTNDGQSSVACDHIRSVSKQRLQKKTGTLSKPEQQAVTNILEAMFAA